MRLGRLAVVLGVGLALVGCSQVAAIAPVGGDRVSEVRYAALDILFEKQVDVLIAPVCSMSEDRAVSCDGKAVGGASITVESTSTDQASFSVAVDGTVLYDGSIQQVLDDSLELP